MEQAVLTPSSSRRAAHWGAALLGAVAGAACGDRCMSDGAYEFFARRQTTGSYGATGTIPYFPPELEGSVLLDGGAATVRSSLGRHPGCEVRYRAGANDTREWCSASISCPQGPEHSPRYSLHLDVTTWARDGVGNGRATAWEPASNTYARFHVSMVPTDGGSP